MAGTESYGSLSFKNSAEKGREAKKAVAEAVSAVMKSTKDLAWALLSDIKNNADKTLDNAKRSVDNMEKKFQNYLKSWVEALKSSYRNVSERVKNTVNSGVEVWKRTINQGREFVQRKIQDFNQWKKMIVEAVKNWSLKGVKILKETGHLVVNIAGKTYEYSVNTGKSAINQLKNYAHQGIVQAVNIVKGTGEVAITIWKNVIKVTVMAAVGAGYLLYQGGKFVVNKTILTGKMVADTTGKYVKKTIDTGKQVVSAGRQELANWFRIIADKVDDRPKNTFTQYAQAER